jgi:sortase A
MSPPVRLYGPPLAPRGRRRRLWLLAVLALGSALLAAGLWLPAKAELAQHLLNRAWAVTDDGGAAVKPWPWADTWPVAQLRLPGGSEPLIVLAGASGRNLAFGPALLDGTVSPGDIGLSVIAGHRDTHFRALAELAVGDRFEVERTDGRVFLFEVTGVDVVDSRSAVLEADAGATAIALVTCYPFDALEPRGPMRYIVAAHLVAPLETPAARPASWARHRF